MTAQAAGFYAARVAARSRAKDRGGQAPHVQMYKQEMARRQLQHSGMSLEAFLETLDLQITIAPMTPQQLPRTAQMTERTNQFNFTTIRRRKPSSERWPLTGPSSKWWTFAIVLGITGW